MLCFVSMYLPGKRKEKQELRTDDREGEGDSWEAWGAGREQKIKAYGKNSALNIMRYFYR